MNGRNHPKLRKKNGSSPPLLGSITSSLVLLWVEPLLWTLLAVALVVHAVRNDTNSLDSFEQVWPAALALLGSFGTLVALATNPPTYQSTEPLYEDDRKNQHDSNRASSSSSRAKVSPTTSMDPWRRQSLLYSQNTIDPQGQSMVVVVPILLQAISRCNGYWLLYVKVASCWCAILPCVAIGRSRGVLRLRLLGRKEIGVGIGAIGIVAGTVGLQHHVDDSSYSTLGCLQTVGMVAIGAILQKCVCWYPSFQQVFTKGEWGIVSFLGAMAVTECATLCFFPPSIISTTATTLSSSERIPFPIHSCVSLAGLVGCICGCVAASFVKSLPVKCAFLVVVPFLFIEKMLHSVQEDDTSYYSANNNMSRWHTPNWPIPRFAIWIIDFLLEEDDCETTPLAAFGNHAFVSHSSSWTRVRRGSWLLYWMVLLAITLPLSPRSSSFSVVARRKWFHGVAVLLFVPVTLVAPKLMSLAYAIASALVFVLEHIRPFLPSTHNLDAFYTAFLDKEKDSSFKGKVVVTHMALIIGCAMPLWISEMIAVNQTQQHQQQSRDEYIVLLRLWGVLSLGVGDAMGAVVGKAVGSIRWHPSGTSGRTLEGSLAMWIGMMASCYCLGITSSSPEDKGTLVPVWFAAVTVVTLMEAWTHQIDNLVLPLLGAAVLLTHQKICA